VNYRDYKVHHTCKTCKWSEDGECHGGPPCYYWTGTQRYREWPLVGEDDYCKEWEQRYAYYGRKVSTNDNRVEKN
jgi:hypothetical protein